MKKNEKKDSEKCNDIIEKCNEKDLEVSEYLFQNSINGFTTLQSWISSECIRALEIICIIKHHHHGKNKKILNDLEKNISSIKNDSESALKGILSTNNPNSRISSQTIQRISDGTSKLSETVTELYKIRDNLINLIKNID